MFFYRFLDTHIYIYSNPSISESNGPISFYSAALMNFIKFRFRQAGPSVCLDSLIFIHLLGNMSSIVLWNLKRSDKYFELEGLEFIIYMYILCFRISQKNVYQSIGRMRKINSRIAASTEILCIILI